MKKSILFSRLYVSSSSESSYGHLGHFYRLNKVNNKRTPSKMDVSPLSLRLSKSTLIIEIPFRRLQDHWIRLDHQSFYFNLKWHSDHLRLQSSSIFLDQHQIILPFENTVGSGKTARNFPEIAKAGTPDQPDLSSQTDSSDPPNS